MSKIRELEPQVLYALERYPQTRNDDFVLVGVVWSIGFGLDPLMPFAEAFKQHKTLGLPSWDSITRIRRKLVAEVPELRGTDRKEKERLEAQPDFIGYALDTDDCQWR